MSSRDHGVRSIVSTTTGVAEEGSAWRCRPQSVGVGSTLAQRCPTRRSGRTRSHRTSTSSQPPPRGRSSPARREEDTVVTRKSRAPSCMPPTNDSAWSNDPSTDTETGMAEKFGGRDRGIGQRRRRFVGRTGGRFGGRAIGGFGRRVGRGGGRGVCNSVRGRDRRHLHARLRGHAVDRAVEGRHARARGHRGGERGELRLELREGLCPFLEPCELRRRRPVRRVHRHLVGAVARGLCEMWLHTEEEPARAPPRPSPRRRGAC